MELNLMAILNDAIPTGTITPVQTTRNLYIPADSKPKYVLVLESEMESRTGETVTEGISMTGGFFADLEAYGSSSKVFGIAIYKPESSHDGWRYTASSYCTYDNHIVDAKTVSTSLFVAGLTYKYWLIPEGVI